MADDHILLNDGTSSILLNDGSSFLLLNGHPGTWACSWGRSWLDSWGDTSECPVGPASRHASWACSWDRAWLDSWGDTSACVVVTPPAPDAEQPLGGNYYDWWEREWARIREERAKRKKKKVPKKKRTLLDELDEHILELRARIREGEVTRETKIEIRKLQRFSDAAVQAAITAKQIELYNSFALALIREIDDEEAILLCLH